MNQTSPITAEQALNVLQKQQLARMTLTGFARWINIPGVPDDGDIDDRITTVVETPLALHHIVGLQAMQLLVQHALVYDPQVLDSPVDFALLRQDWTRHPGPNRWGGVSKLGQAPFTNSTEVQKVPENPLVPQVTDLPQIGIGAGARSAKNHGVLPEKQPFLPVATNRYVEHRRVLGDLLSGSIEDLEARQRLMDADKGGSRLEVCNRVMLMEPPGSAKSTYGSVVCPAWVLGRQKMFEMILTGWGDPICRRHGKRARQICASAQYKAVFGTEMDPKTTAAEDWALLNASSYKSSGITSGVSGFRCNGLVWDDLTKNRKEADSPTIRNDTYNEYIDSARSRKTPNAWEIGIGTRWNEDEVMGRLLPEGYSGESGFMRCRDGNVWLVICMAAECERVDDPLGREIGEMIWPEWFGEDFWLDKRRNARSWGSLYQQRPAPDSGIIFQREDDRRSPGDIVGDHYISFDPALSEAEDSDDTAIHVWVVDERGGIHEIDEWVRKCTMDVWIDQLMTFIRIYKPLEVISESGMIRRAAEPFIKRAMIKKNIYAKFEWVTRHADKVAMARPAQAMHASHQIYLLDGPLGDRFMDELVMFPAGKNDHRVDSLANLCLRLEVIWDSRVPVKKDNKPVNIGSFSGEPTSIKKFMPDRFNKRKSRWNLKSA